MKKLYLNLGFHKTASSSFQETCANNLEFLSSMGFIYPIFKMDGMIRISNHSLPLFLVFNLESKHDHLFKEWSQENIKYYKVAFKKQFEDCLLTGKDIIISGETLSTLGTESLQNLRDFITGYGYDIDVFSFVRSPYSFHCSAVQQRVKSGAYTDLTHFSTQIHKIETILRVFKNAKFFPFKYGVKYTRGPVNFLLNYCNIYSDEIDIIFKNIGISNKHVRGMNESLKCGKTFDFGDIEDGEGKFYLTWGEFYEIYQHLKWENDFFEHTLGEEFLDDSICISKS